MYIRCAFFGLDNKLCRPVWTFRVAYEVFHFPPRHTACVFPHNKHKNTCYTDLHDSDTRIFQSRTQINTIKANCTKITGGGNTGI